MMIIIINFVNVCVSGMAGSMGQAGMSSYYGPAYGSLSAASMAAAAAAAAQQSAAAMSAGLGAPSQVSFHSEKTLASNLKIVVSLLFL